MNNKEKVKAISNYLMGAGNYDFPFNKYVESVEQATGKRVHPFVYFYEFFYDDPTLPGHSEKMSYEEFAKLIKGSPDFDPYAPFVWFGADDKLHSSYRIFPDIYSVSKVSEWCVEHNDDLGWDDTIHEILFGKENEHED